MLYIYYYTNGGYVALLKSPTIIAETLDQVDIFFSLPSFDHEPINCRRMLYISNSLNLSLFI